MPHGDLYDPACVRCAALTKEQVLQKCASPSSLFGASMAFATQQSVTQHNLIALAEQFLSLLQAHDGWLVFALLIILLSYLRRNVNTAGQSITNPALHPLQSWTSVPCPKRL
jgi:hypothetical protein